MLFADATALTAEPALSGPARDAIRAVAAHLADLIRRAQADGEISSGADPEAAAWLLLSVLSARRLRAAAMPDGLEPAVAAITLQAITSPLPAALSGGPADQGQAARASIAAGPVPNGKVLSPPAPAPGRTARAAVEGFAQPPVLLGLDLSPGQPLHRGCAVHCRAAACHVRPDQVSG